MCAVRSILARVGGLVNTVKKKPDVDFMTKVSREGPRLVNELRDVLFVFFRSNQVVVGKSRSIQIEVNAAQLLSSQSSATITSISVLDALYACVDSKIRDID